MMKNFNHITLDLLCSVILIQMGYSDNQQKPEGFKQILPRGRIAAITSPDFVLASKAKIGDNSWILGVVIHGEARAYSLNLLNAHEIVNDRIDSTRFAAVW
jgi:hypothetical protein